MSSVKTTNLNVRCLVALTVILFGLSSTSLLRAESTIANNAVRQEIRSLNSQLHELDLQMREIKELLLNQSQHIADLKNDQGDSENPFLHYRLQRALKSAQSLAAQLQQLENKKANLQLKTRSAEQQLSILVNKQLEQVTLQLAQAKVTPQEKRQLSAELAHLVQENAQLNNRQSNTALQNATIFVPDKNDDLEDLTNKAASLRDLKDKTKKELNEVKNLIANLQRQELVFKEARYLMDEEAFFAEMSFAKNNPENSTTTPGGDSKTADTKTTTTDTAIPPSQINSVVTDSTNSTAIASNSNSIGNVAHTNSINPTTAIPAPTASSEATTLNSPYEVATRRVQIDQVFAKRNNEKISFKEQLLNLRHHEAALQEQLHKIDVHLDMILNATNIK